MPKPKILSISYDPPLLRTRQLILQQAGYLVTSALGFAEAMESCRSDFDLIVMGHSIPQADKDVIIAVTKIECPAPVLSIRGHADPPNRHADFSVDANDGPEALLACVRRALKPDRKPAQPTRKHAGDSNETEATPGR